MKYEWTAEAPGWKLSDGEIDWSVMSGGPQPEPSLSDKIDALVAKLKELNASEAAFAEAVKPKPDPKLTARDQAMARALTFSGDYDCRALWLLY